jgi:hypothetical protein
LKVPFEGVAANEDEDALDDEDSRDDEDALEDEDTPVAEDKGTPDEDDIFSLGSLELEMSAELLLDSSPLEEDRRLAIPALDDDPMFWSISGALEQAKNKTAAATHKNMRTLL